jgi:hypothetical protein
VHPSAHLYWGTGVLQSPRPSNGQQSPAPQGTSPGRNPNQGGQYQSYYTPQPQP